MVVRDIGAKVRKRKKIIVKASKMKQHKQIERALSGSDNSFEKFLESHFFLNTKNYYNKIHEKGIDYFEKSIEYLSVKSNEYYAIIKQNELMRNAFVLIVYLFLFSKLISMLLSCQSSQTNISACHKRVKNLEKQIKQISMQLSILSLKLNKSSESSFNITHNDLYDMKLDLLAFMNDVFENDCSHDMSSFFHDSVKDLWSEIKVIKSRLSVSKNDNGQFLVFVNHSKIPVQSIETLQKIINQISEPVQINNAILQEQTTSIHQFRDIID